MPKNSGIHGARQIKDGTVSLAKLDSSIVDVNGKLLASLLPTGFGSGLTFAGVIDPATADIPPPSEVAAGSYYIVNGEVKLNGVATPANVIDQITGQAMVCRKGDWVVSDGATYYRIDNSEPELLRGKLDATQFNGATTTFELTATNLISDTVRLICNRLELDPDGDYSLNYAYDYTYNVGHYTVTFTEPPISTDVIRWTGYPV